MRKNQGVDVVERNESQQNDGEFRHVPVESIRLSKFNARRRMDGKSLTELSLP